MTGRNLALDVMRGMTVALIVRTAIIFLLGYLMYWFPFVHWTETGWAFNPIGETRIFGVLQRIALGYGLGAIIIRYGNERGALIFSVVALLGRPIWSLAGSAPSPLLARFDQCNVT